MGYDCNWLSANAVIYGNAEMLINVNKKIKLSKMYARLLLILLGGGALMQAVAAPVMPPAASISRTVAYAYHQDTGFLSTTTIEPDNPQLRLDAVIKYDAWGNRNVTSISSTATGDRAIAIRENRIAFDGRGQFMSVASNALSQASSFTFDPLFGSQRTITDVNGLITEIKYDSFGRKILAIGADGNRIKWDYQFCSGINGGNGTCPTDAKYVVQETPLAADGVTMIGAWNKTYFDELDRAIGEEVAGFDGSIITVSREYDQNGRISRVSRPYYKGKPIHWNVIAYDAIGRVSTIVGADGVGTTYTYNGMSSTVKNALGQVKTSINNIQGKISKSIDNNGSELSYYHNASGDLWKTVDAKGNVIAIAYDTLGRKVQMDDPDLGTVTYINNVLGEVVSQTNAKGKVSKFSYDKLGRLIARSQIDLISTWLYDSCEKGVGKLCKVSADNTYSETFSYDKFGRDSVNVVNIDGPFTTSVTYDTNGRLSKKTFPAGLNLSYTYTQTGYLKEVRDYDSNALYWTAQEMGADESMLKQAYGNGIITTKEFHDGNGFIRKIYAGTGNGVQNIAYDFDAIGNLRSRIDYVQGLTESFLYDKLNRVQTSTVNSGAAGLVTQTYSYDDIGNIESLSGIGKYKYDTSPKVLPHAVGTIQLGNGGIRRFEYDENGNLSKDFTKNAAGINIPSAERAIYYTSFDMPSRISMAGKNFDFVYDSSHTRIKEIGPDSTTFYVHPNNFGDLNYEKEIRRDGSMEHRQFISIGGEIIAVVKQKSGIKSIEYFHRDQLGSTVAISNEAGVVVERLAYEPFGKRQYANGVKDTTDSIKGVNSDRGFTNHQHLDEVGLIHMNGRVYDPVIARFLSADPTVSDPENMQSFNRYAYAYGNPLAFVDPSGYTNEKTMPEIIIDSNGQWRNNFDWRYDPFSYDYFNGRNWSYQGGAAMTPNGQVVNMHGKKIEPANTGGKSFWQSIGDGIKDAYSFVSGSREQDEYNSCFPHGCSPQQMREIDRRDDLRTKTNRVLAVLPGVATEALSVRGTQAVASLIPCRCFVAGTLVHTSTGLKKIELIKVGDLVAARDEDTGMTSWKPVVSLIRNGEKNVLRVQYVDVGGKSEVLGVTPEHPFMLEGKRWVSAGELKPGDKIMSLGGALLTVKRISKYSVRHHTYNFEVADFHTYFVGKKGAWVHNAPCNLQPGWIAKDLYSKLTSMVDSGKMSVSTLNKFENALKSFASGQGGQGIKPLVGNGPYGYELKILGKQDGGYRLYGNMQSNGQVVFDQLRTSH
ncbi:polymorphic toxin-type HINT domain-containing protein [Janthinobacterium sp. SUN118]|uniref:polymorphic toxin-type HINT domain-containing protein n=1 Tax=Janthinobacterium sp. SUN118 TaxID=3004100 RepID=UPI0025B264DF|nr:polymorphic toxin-type HINT domain-containing protein [Janthinobacterium sp. SUN118]MDN2709880.1 polymorphic toxin-type HINT domain-containing protein [Janthinobacterium sp. SUN118]